ncbi:MAG: DNA primase [Verrucomicrobia bacterium]|nr:MAG: DNA primase [Verrucomicrobiota bacterium]PYJ33741.1 MAG: DNA primase [Verrucomicrobiota bacterium]
MPEAKVQRHLAMARQPRRLCESLRGLEYLAARQEIMLQQLRSLSPPSCPTKSKGAFSQFGQQSASRKFDIASKAKRGKNNQARMGTIPSETIEQIAAANDIVEVIGSYFPLKRAGANFRALCPFHQEKTPSFMVSPSRQTFHCFGCGAGGSVFRFVVDYEHVDFPTAVRKLAARAGITVVEKSGRRGAGDEERQRELRQRLLKLHGEAAQWFHENLIKREVGKAARGYLRSRGITVEIAKRWQLGYAPDEWDAFGCWARSRDYDVRDLIASGLVKVKDDSDSIGSQRSVSAQRTAHATASYDRFRGRIMFPICNDIGEVIAFSGRLLQNEDGAAKYLNSPETALFRKGSVLFGLDKSKRALIEADCAVVCEGQLDLISLFESGITNVVAPQGTAFTEGQARILKRFVNEVVLCFDADAAGQKAAERSLDALLQNDLIVRVAEMPAGEDPDSLVRREGKIAFEKRIADARDFFDYWIEREAANVDLNSLSAKMEVARTLAETVSHVHDPVMRGEVISKISARLAVSTSAFAALVSKQVRKGPSEVTTERRQQQVPPNDIALLCILALRSEEAHQFLRARSWREVLSQLPSTYFLERILESEVRPNDSASLSAFLASLEPEEEDIISGWLHLKTPPNSVAVPWLRLRQAALRRQLDIAKDRLRLPELSTGDVINLQKQILDLQEQLHELSQPAGAADS